MTARTKSLTPNRYGYLFVAPYFIFFFVFGLYPILYSLRISFLQWDGYSPQVFVGLDNYARLLKDTAFRRAIGNTVKISLIAIVFQMGTALLVSVLLSGAGRRLRNTLKAVYYFPNLVTPVSIATLFSVIFGWQNGSANMILKAMGLISENVNWMAGTEFAQGIISFILWYQYFGYYIILFMAGINGIDPTIMEAAQIDGASRAQSFWRITLPMLRPIINYASIVAIIGGMQIFDLNYIIGGKMGNPNGFTMSITQYMYVTTFSNYNYGYGAAVSYALFIMTALFSAIYLKMMTRKEGA